MKKLKVFVCENFYPDYEEAIKREGIEDIELIAFPTLCDQKGRKVRSKRNI